MTPLGWYARATLGRDVQPRSIIKNPMSRSQEPPAVGWMAATMLNVLAPGDLERGWRALRAAGWKVRDGWAAVAPDGVNAVVLKGDGVWMPTTANDDGTINHA